MRVTTRKFVVHFIYRAADTAVYENSGIDIKVSSINLKGALKME